MEKNAKNPNEKQEKQEVKMRIEKKEMCKKFSRPAGSHDRITQKDGMNGRRQLFCQKI